MKIRLASDSDLDAMWHIFQGVTATGDAVPFADGFDRDTFRSHWYGPHTAYIAVDDACVLGMYKWGANYPGRGSHVASATYLVGAEVQGRGIGRALVQHSLARARDAGYLAMQFNYVVSTNARAVELYRKLGFAIVGTIPKAFRHEHLGLVDTYIMHRFLDS